MPPLALIWRILIGFLDMRECKDFISLIPIIYGGGWAAYRKEEAPPMQSIKGFKALFGTETNRCVAFSYDVTSATVRMKRADANAVSMQGLRAAQSNAA